MAEVVGSYGYSLYSWSPDIPLNPHFGFGYVGYALATVRWFDGFAYFGGVFALSFLIAVVAVFSVDLQRKQKLQFTPKQWLLMTCFVVIGVYGYSNAHTPTPHTPSKLLTINTHFTNERLATDKGQSEKAENIRAAVTYAMLRKPDYLLLPEDTRLTRFAGSADNTLEWLSGLSNRTVVVDSTTVEVGRELVVLRAFIYDTAANKTWLVDKQYLVPVGEFVPSLIDLAIRILAPENLASKFEARAKYVPGTLTIGNEVPSSIQAFYFVQKPSQLLRPGFWTDSTALTL